MGFYWSMIIDLLSVLRQIETILFFGMKRYPNENAISFEMLSATCDIQAKVRTSTI